MSEYVDLPKQLTKPLLDEMMKYPLLEYGRIRSEERQFGMIEDRIAVITFSRERETPHFLLRFQGKECRFRLDKTECEPMDKIPREIERFYDKIKVWYKQNRVQLIHFYNDNLADTAPPQAKVRLI